MKVPNVPHPPTLHPHACIPDDVRRKMNAELILYNSHLQQLYKKYYLPKSTGLEPLEYGRFITDIMHQEAMAREFIQLLHEMPRCEDE